MNNRYSSNKLRKKKQKQKTKNMDKVQLYFQ